MARRRIRPSLSIVNRPIGKAARMVTLHDPNAATTMAQGAFVRLQPSEGTTLEAIASWRNVVAKVAIAVRVLPAPTAALVPAASERSDADPCGTIREEAMALAEETGDAAVKAMTVRILDEVGA